jgi:hypothetical protein
MSLWLWLVGCCYTLPSEEGPFEGPLVPSQPVKLRERKLILPGFSSTPPPPEPAVTSGNCDDLDDGGPVAGPGCITGEVRCGQTVVGHTKGGVKKFDTKFYEKKFCMPALEDRSGGDERVYRLVMPEGEWRAFVWMDSPCADLDLSAMMWNGDDCPTVDSNVSRCEAEPQKGANGELVELTHQGQATWLLVVEGKDEQEGAFALHVQCRQGLH